MWGIGIVTCPALGQLAYELQEKGKRMKASQLTTIAALPQGGGCMAQLPAEKNEQPKVQMKAPYFDELAFPPIDPSLLTDEEFGRRYLAACEGKDA